jgi:nicotinamide riboside transporter PnuC
VSEYGYVNRLAAFFTSPFVLLILLLFVLAIIGIYVWKKTGK